MMTTAGQCLDTHIEGAINFRDLGGYRAAGGRVRAGRLYRSGMMHGITAAGLTTLAERFGVQSVIDLRAQDELDQNGVAPFDQAGIRHIHLPVYPTFSAEMKERQRRFFQAPLTLNVDEVAEGYVHNLEAGVDCFRTFFALLAESDTLPAVFHCSGGRDRTGVAAALVLTVAGVDADDIAHDYQLTGGYLARHARKLMHINEGVTIDEDEMILRLATHAEVMHGFLTRLDARYGSVAGYLAHIGVPDDQVTAVRAHLFEADA